MKRRKLLFTSGGIFLSSLIHSKYTLQQKSLAADYSFNMQDSISFDYVESPEMNLKFDKFILKTNNIDNNKPLNIYLKVSPHENNELHKVRDEKTIENWSTNKLNHDITDELNSSRLKITGVSEDGSTILDDISNKTEIGNKSGYTLDLDVQILIELDSIKFKTKKENITITINEQKELPSGGLSYHFDNGPYGASTGSSSVDIRDTHEIVDFEPIKGTYTVDVKFIEDGNYASDESADYELGVQLLDENNNIVNSLSRKFTIRDSKTVSGSATGVFNPGANYSWRFYLASNGATVTSWSPNHPNNEGYVDLYLE